MQKCGVGIFIFQQTYVKDLQKFKLQDCNSVKKSTPINRINQNSVEMMETKKPMFMSIEVW